MTDPTRLPSAIAMRIAGDETLLWSGAPDLSHCRIPMLRLIPGALFLAISLILCVMGVRSAILSGSAIPLVIPLFTVPFFVAGYALVRAPIRRRALLPDSQYAITDKRLIIAHARDSSLFRSVALENICGIQRWQRKDGFGALEIETNAQANRELVFNIVMLDGIAEVDQVEKLLVKLTGVSSTSSTGGVPASKIPEPASTLTI
jgi:hypothetical protein